MKKTSEKVYISNEDFLVLLEKELERARKELTPEQAFENLVRIGILNKDGKPTKHYKNLWDSLTPI
jgi:hypothetical protein